MYNPSTEVTVANITYIAPAQVRQTQKRKSIEVIGIDTEAYTDGKCFLICTSRGDAFSPADFPSCFFSRDYRGSKFVCWNLKYEQSALLQHLPIENLKQLQEDDETTHGEYSYHVISNKALTIRKGKNNIVVYDALSFYESSLQKAAKDYLGESKIDIETKSFTREYAQEHWTELVNYCIQDAKLAKRLMDAMIVKFEAFGVHPQKLYSKAYISWQYFKERCPYVHVKRFWRDVPRLIEFALKSYNGGKFEVTRKGPGYYYEYDIVSAYPFEIANLVDIRKAWVSTSRKYKADALYGFLDCTMQIPYSVMSPVSQRRKLLNYYPVGTFRRVITKAEYDYLIKYGCDVTIHDAYWLGLNSVTYPYREEIDNLLQYKTLYKKQGDMISYNLVKKILNSFYGKLVQLIHRKDRYKAGSSWNPIYGSIITANTRIRVSEMQQQYNSVVAVHTDSVVCTEPLPIQTGNKLGEWEKSKEGYGLILGSGIYQIGNKSRIRGLETKKWLQDIIPRWGNKISFTQTKPYTWREVAHRSMDASLINRFSPRPKHIKVNFDTKRVWINDYTDFDEVYDRNVESIAWDAGVETLLR